MNESGKSQGKKDRDQNEKGPGAALVRACVKSKAGRLHCRVSLSPDSFRLVSEPDPPEPTTHGRRGAASPARGPRPRRRRRRRLAVPSCGAGGAAGPGGAPAQGQGAGVRGLDGRGAAADPREPGAGIRGVPDQRARAPGARRTGDPLQAPLRRHRRRGNSRHRRPALRRSARGHGRAALAGLGLEL